jgi:hypothetical protein
MPTLRWRLGCRRTIRSPRLGEQCFCRSVDEGHLARCRIGALRVIHESIWVMLAGEPSTCGANLIGARAEWDAEDLVWRAAPRHRGASSPVAISAGSGLRSVTCGAATGIETKCSPLPYDERRTKEAPCAIY